MRTADFFQLSRAAQDHFVDATTGTQPPAPVLVRRGGPTSHRIGWGVAAVAALALAIAWRHGFGEASSGAVVYGAGLVALWIVLVALVVGGAAHALGRAWEIARLPWRAGIYAFPDALVDARIHVLRVREVAELARVEASGGAVRLVYEDAVYAFPSEEPAASAARDAIEEARRSWPREADPARDSLAEPRIVSPFASTEPRARGRVRATWIAYAVAGVAALSLGPASFFARNAASDERAFTIAKGRDDVTGYRAYLARGARHRDEVQRELLPRAELRVAEEAGTVDALLAYEAAHPSSAIQSDVDAALRRALLAELEEAKKAGTLAALRAFDQRRPGHGLSRELAAARHRVYQAALAAFERAASAKDAAVIPFFARLLAHAEAHADPRVEIRFRNDPSKSLARADKYVSKLPLFNGETSYPTRYLEPAKAAPDEAALARSIVDELAASFPKEILSASTGAPVAAGDPLPTPSVPTLFVVHRAEWNGTGYASRRPRGVYVGVDFHFEATFVVPGDGDPLTVKATVGDAVPQALLGELGKRLVAPGEAERAIYSEMRAKAFEELTAKLQTRLGKGSLGRR